MSQHTRRHGQINVIGTHCGGTRRRCAPSLVKHASRSRAQNKHSSPPSQSVHSTPHTATFHTTETVSLAIFDQTVQRWVGHGTMNLIQSVAEEFVRRGETGKDSKSSVPERGQQTPFLPAKETGEGILVNFESIYFWIILGISRKNHCYNNN